MSEFRLSLKRFTFPLQTRSFENVIVREDALRRGPLEDETVFVTPTMPHNASLEQKTKASPEQLAAMLDCARELLAVVNAEGVILQANREFSSLLGIHAEQLAGRELTEFMHPDDAAELRAHLPKLTSTSGSRCSRRCRLRSKSGEWRHFDAAMHNCLPSGAIEGLVVSFQDVSILQRMEAERQVISEVVHALNQTANLDELLHGIHQALNKVVYAENCFIALHASEADSFYFPFFVDQFDSAPPPQKVGRSCTAYVFRTGRGMLIPQTEFDRLVRQGEVELVGSPSPSWLGVPLKTPTETIGVLVVQHYENDNAYDVRDLEFLDSVGGHIALAIERRRSEEALRKSESVFRLLFSNNPLPTWVMDDETLQFIQVNDAAVRQYGYSAREFARMGMRDINVEAQPSSREARQADALTGCYQGFCKHRKKDGKIFEAELTSHQFDYAGKRVRLVVAQDISERHLLEQQLRQAQKMEAVGRLAGGVAHDFNNLLMVIKGHSELLMNSLPPADRTARKIAQIDRAADRATALTKQLLAFSRMQVLQPRVMNLNGVVEDMGKLLPRLIGEDIELSIRTAPDLGSIRADASQMEQIIMNLAVNARDAMPNGGRLFIETSNAELDQAYNLAHPIVQSGSYVLLAVSDTGIGMDAETQAHIFEPFFTTKEAGKGTGLGLATVYGVVKQSGGFIWVYSELGKGTSFKIYLPRVDQPEEKTSAPNVSGDAPRGAETILLAEDEQDVREVAREFLESAGYTVVEAHDGSEALRLAGDKSQPVDLLVTDMVMPGMTGTELAQRMQILRPGLAAIFMSGYTEQTAAETAQADGNMYLLTKPFSRSGILRVVREALNAARVA
jgi:two-component system, cell cycle sensor histidine kinase and response regulator CckA